jgi:hypothetical protein
MVALVSLAYSQFRPTPQVVFDSAISNFFIQVYLGLNRGASLGYKAIASPESQEFEPLPERDPSAELHLNQGC